MHDAVLTPVLLVYRTARCSTKSSCAPRLWPAHALALHAGSCYRKESANPALHVQPGSHSRHALHMPGPTLRASLMLPRAGLIVWVGCSCADGAEVPGGICPSGSAGLLAQPCVRIWSTGRLATPSLTAPVLVSAAARHVTPLCLCLRPDQLGGRRVQIAASCSRQKQPTGRILCLHVLEQ